jgi:hypothetical protein
MVQARHQDAPSPRFAALTKKDLAGVIDGQDGLAFRAAETAGLGRLEFLRADGARKDLRKDGGALGLLALIEESYRVFEVILDIEELGEAQELEYFVDLRLDFEEDEIAAALLHALQEGGEGADAGGRNVVQAAAMENEARVSGLYGLGDALLEKIGIVGIDVSSQEENEASIDLLGFLKAYLEAIVLFVVEPGNDIIIIHGTPLPTLFSEYAG